MKIKYIIYSLVLFLYSTSTWAQIFNFEKEASKARWESSTIDANSNALPNTTTKLKFGKSFGEAGITVVKNAVMENGKNYRVLHMHPRWSKNGTIKGWFPPIVSFPEDASLSGKIGFIKPNGTPGTDGARFMIYAHYYVNGKKYLEPILDSYKNYTERLMPFRIDLKKYAGKKVFFELRVDAGESAGQDWAAWVDTKVDYTMLSGRLQFYTETVNLNEIKNLCPSSLVGGDPEFGGNGPKVFGYVNLSISEDKKQIIAKIKFNARETNKDFLTGRSEVQGYWESTVYIAPNGKLISGFTDAFNTITKFEKVLKGGGGNELFGGGRDGAPHILTRGDGLNNKGHVMRFEVVGDTGGWDISTDDNCTNDTRILKISFKPLDLEFIEQL